MNEGANVSLGENSGEAQIFKPFDFSAFDRNAALQMRQRQMQQNRDKSALNSLYSQMTTDNKGKTFDSEADREAISRATKEMNDSLLKNNNAQKIVRQEPGYEKLIHDFKDKKLALDHIVNTSVEKQGQFINAANAMVANPDKYDDEASAHLQALRDEKYQEGKSPMAFDPTQMLHKVSKEDIHKQAVANRGTLYPTSFPKKNPDGSVTETTVTQFGPKEAYNTAKYTIENNPNFIRHYNKEFEKLPEEEKLLYINPKTNNPDPIEYGAQEEAKKIEISPKVKQTETQGKSGMNLTFGNGMATNGKYNFVTQDRIKEEPTPTIFDKNKKKVTPYKVISIQRTDAGENKGFFFDDPAHEGKKIEVIPKEYEQNANGDWTLIGVPKNGGKEIHIPEKDVTADMKAITGVDLNEIIQGEGNTDETKVAGSKAVPSNLIARKDKSGRVALFDKNKKFVRWQ